MTQNTVILCLLFQLSEKYDINAVNNLKRNKTDEVKPLIQSTWIHGKYRNESVSYSDENAN